MILRMLGWKRLKAASLEPDVTPYYVRAKHLTLRSNLTGIFT